MIQKRTASRLSLLLLGALAAPPAAALSDTDFQGAVNYDFRPPGARSLGMGGAFTALADDATAALANPAGIVQLKRPEFSFAAKAWTDDMHLDWGSGSHADLSGIGPNMPAQARIERDFFATKAAPAFAGFVYTRARVSFALFRARTLEYDNHFSRDEIAIGPFLLEDCTTPPCTVTPDTSFLSTALTQASGRIRHRRDLGLSFAVDLGGHFSLGLSAYSSSLKFSARSTRYAQTTTAASDKNATLIVDERGDDRALGFAAGLLYAGDAWRVGLSYASAEAYAVRVTPSRGPRGSALRLRSPFTTELRVPERASLGIAWRPLPLWTLSGELEGIRWSRLARNLHSFQSDPTAADPDAPNRLDNAYRMDDALNPHLGSEWVTLADTFPLSVRLGVWWEHGHRLKYVGHQADQRAPYSPGVNLLVPGATLDEGQKVLSPGGGSQQHFTAGIGFVAGKLQFDAAYDHAKWSRQFALSTIYRF